MESGNVRKLSSYENLVVRILSEQGKACAVDITKALYPNEPDLRTKLSQVSVVLRRLEKKGAVLEAGREGKKVFFGVKEDFKTAEELKTESLGLMEGLPEVSKPSLKEMDVKRKEKVEIAVEHVPGQEPKLKRVKTTETTYELKLRHREERLVTPDEGRPLRSGREGEIIEILRELKEAAASDIAKRLFEGADKDKTVLIAVYLKRLAAKGLVTGTGKVGRKTFYSLATKPRPEEKPAERMERLGRQLGIEGEVLQKLREMKEAAPSELAPAIFPVEGAEKTAQLYVTLKRMEEKGLVIVARKEGKKTYFTITPERPPLKLAMPRFEFPHVRPPHIAVPHVPRAYAATGISLAIAALIFFQFTGGLGFFAAPANVLALSLEQQTTDGLQNFIYGVKNINTHPISQLTAEAVLPSGSQISDAGGAQVSQRGRLTVLSWALAQINPDEKQTFSFSGQAPGQIQLFAQGLSEREQTDVLDAPVQAELPAGQHQYKKLDVEPKGHLSEIALNLAAGPSGTAFTNETVTVPEMPITNMTENITEVLINETAEQTATPVQNETQNITELNTMPNATENVTQNATENITTQPSQPPPTGGAVMPAGALTNVKIYLDADGVMNGNEDLIGEVGLSGAWDGTMRMSVPAKKYNGSVSLVFYSDNGAVVLLKSVSLKWTVEMAVNASETVEGGGLQAVAPEEGATTTAFSQDGKSAETQCWPGLSDGKDTFINCNQPDQNVGDKRYLFVGRVGNKCEGGHISCFDDYWDDDDYDERCSCGITYRTLVEFNISNIPAGATINSARLEMYHFSNIIGVVDVHKLNRSWEEMQATWNKAKSTVPWTTPGADFYGTVYASKTTVNNGWVVWNVTALVQEWVDSDRNYGMLLKAADENQVKKYKFRSSEYQDGSYRPKLIINWTTDGTPPNVTLVAPANGSSTAFGLVNFTYKVSDASNITACSLLLNGTINQTSTAVTKNVDQTFTQNLSAGNLSWAVKCTDASGNIGYSETRRLTIVSGYILRENVTDSSGRPWKTEIIIRDTNGTVVYNSTDTAFQTVILPGHYNITISPMELAPIINITFVDVVITGDINQLVDFEQLLNDITFLDPHVLYNDLFSLNFVLTAQFDHIEYTAVADGPNLYKCRWFDFESRQCLGQWIKIRNDLVPGEVYRQVLKTAGDPAFGEGTDKFVLTNITINGNLTDWDAVLDNAAQVMTDGISGINDNDTVGNAARDLTKSAFTWNQTYLFMYFRRVASPGPAINMVVYIDVNGDGSLNQSTDRVARFQWTSNGDYDFNLGRYSASNGIADPLTGDGVDEPGTFINNTLVEQNIPGGSGNDLELEVRLNWTLLNVTPGTPLKFHISSARGDASDLPAQIEDNMNAIDTMLSDVDIFPDNSGGAKAGASITYNHTVRNIGNIADTFDINASSNKKFNFTLAFANGTALSDTDGDGAVDVGKLGPGANVSIRVNITVNATAPTGTVDTTTVKALASLSSVADSVIDVTTVGNLAVFPPRFGRIANNTLITYQHTIINNLGTSPVVDVNATSSHGWGTMLFYSNGTALTDTNGNGRPDVGNLSAGGKINITVKVSVPGVALGTLDTTYVTSNSSDNPLADSGQVKDMTTVALRVEVEPDHDDVAGIGSFVFYEHEVFNNGNISDTIDLLKNSSMGWPTQLFQADKITLLSDTNGNSTPDTGLLQENGGSAKITIKVNVPMTATEGQKDVTTITGISATNSSYRDAAQDNTTAQILVIYNNSARTLKDTDFVINETVYAKAYGLSVASVKFVWVDGNATTVRVSPNMNVDAAGQAVDEFATNASHALGNWTLVLTRTNSVEITRTDFLVIETNPPKVTNVTPAAGSAFNTSTTVTITANVTDDTAVDTVFARVRLPNTTIMDVPMNNSAGGVRYSCNFTATDLAGLYNVTIIANDTFGNVNDTEITWFNVTPPYFVSISLINNLVDFGSMAVNGTNSTSGGSPQPFTIRNDGNVKVNITVSATDLFNASANPSSAYRYAANSTAGGTYYNAGCSITGWTDMPSVATLFLCFLDWADGSDQAETEINVTVPDGEAEGAKTSVVTFIASQA